MNINAFTFPLEYGNIFTLKYYMCSGKRRANMIPIQIITTFDTGVTFVTQQDAAVYALSPVFAPGVLR